MPDVDAGPVNPVCTCQMRVLEKEHKSWVDARGVPGSIQITVVHTLRRLNRQSFIVSINRAHLVSFIFKLMKN